MVFFSFRHEGNKGVEGNIDTLLHHSFTPALRVQLT